MNWIGYPPFVWPGQAHKRNEQHRCEWRFVLFNVPEDCNAAATKQHDGKWLCDKHIKEAKGADNLR